ncbi:nucleotidyltransferase family protein [Actinotalea sp. Marseille-Q4924]|uniref:nucleotidyltransferase family protein n=1 Tax=Actinotalea sp. Marseille-Q4924 TaxID=2866571 RepID=UPI001CE47944|nr:nucleotidyltransferase family protein [Actinotalea sp. Marseille-Q4924]
MSTMSVFHQGRQELHDGLRMAAVALGDAGIPYALCGGYAAWARGAPEPQHDADFVILEKDADAAREAIAGAGLDVRDPPENWLFKAYHHEALIDVLFRMCGEPVDPAIFERADTIEVLAVRMPVLSATDVIAGQLRVLGEHYCDFARLLPNARALREQIDWREVERAVGDNPYARAFLFLAEELGVIESRPAA